MKNVLKTILKCVSKVRSVGRLTDVCVVHTQAHTLDGWAPLMDSEQPGGEACGSPHSHRLSHHSQLKMAHSKDPALFLVFGGWISSCLLLLWSLAAALADQWEGRKLEEKNRIHHAESPTLWKKKKNPQWEELLFLNSLLGLRWC